MTWVSHTTASKHYPIGRSTLRALVAEGQLQESNSTGANGLATRLVRTEDLEALGYVARRADSRAGEERPFLEQQVEDLQHDMTTAIRQSEELTACIGLLRREVGDLNRRLEASVRAEPSVPATVRDWWGRVRRRWHRLTLR